MTIQINFGTGMLIQGIATATDFSASMSPVTTPVAALDITQSSQDIIVDIDVSAYTSNGQQITVVDSPLAPTHSFVDMTPSLATTDSAGLVTVNPLSIYGGTAQVSVVTPVGSRTYSGNVSATGKTITTASVLFAPGSVSKHIYDTIKALWDGKTPGNSTMDTFTSNNYNTSAPAAVRNAALWSGSFGQEAISIMRSDVASAGNFPLMLLSSRHFYCCAHAAPSIRLRYALGNCDEWGDC